MSFRIEDILKRDTRGTTGEKTCKFEKISIECPSDSILQKTLLHRPTFTYYRSISEPHGTTSGDWCQSDRLYHGPEYYDAYRAKAMSYPNIYTRTPLWPSYHFPLNLYPQFYHFSKRKGGQVRFTANQTDALEKRFTSHKYLSPEDRKLLADSLKLSDRQVKTWFQNRRAKWRRSNSVSSNDISSTKYDNMYEKPNEVLVKSRN